MNDILQTYQTGDVIELKLDSVAFGGEAVGRLNGMVIFVRGGLDGERVLAQVSEVKKSFLRADLKEILEPSPFRTQARCPVFGRCGGCQYQHIQYDHQLRIKEHQVSEALERIAHIPNFKVEPILGSPISYDYRSRVDFHIRQGRFVASRQDLHFSGLSNNGPEKYCRKGNHGPASVVRADRDWEEGLTIGFVGTDGRKVLDVMTCPIATPAINEVYQAIRKDAESGLLPIPSWAEVIKFWDTTQGVKYYYLNTRGQVDLKGDEFIVLKVGQFEFKVPPMSFFQVNMAMVPKLVQCVEDMLNLSGTEFLLDCYSGVGLFTLMLSGKVARCVGIESDTTAGRFAMINARDNGVSSVEFFEKSVEKIFKHWKEFLKAVPDKIILDPPRCGCTPPVLKILAQMKCSQIVYVSCNPATLARDVEFFMQNGYVLKKAQPIDLFPQTQHCEVVALLER